MNMMPTCQTPPPEESEPQHFHLRSAGRIVAEDEVAGIVKHYGFFETDNSDGTFQNHLVQTDNREIVKDKAPGCCGSGREVK